jgi:hypothetical protein
MEPVATDNREYSQCAPEEQVSPCAGRGALLIAVAALLPGSDLSTYRGLRLGTSVADAARHTGQDVAAVRVVHTRPALIEELEWRPGYEVKHDSRNPDPVRAHILCFFKGRLFRIVTNYDAWKIEGMTAADLTEAISRTYGVPSAPGGQIPYESNFGSAATVIARWQDEEYSADLVRSPDEVTYALVVASKQMDSAARAAIAEARRLDQAEAPERALEQKRKHESAERLMREKSRATNMPNFRP